MFAITIGFAILRPLTGLTIQWEYLPFLTAIVVDVSAYAIVCADVTQVLVSILTIYCTRCFLRNPGIVMKLYNNMGTIKYLLQVITVVTLY